ncbi:hypothetical protein KAZ01_01880 [Candidatus Gracilibacteria bacterium]|nr:hypothetical protein [Candidatus Gracilibacteria bacterium]
MNKSESSSKNCFIYTDYTEGFISKTEGTIAMHKNKEVFVPHLSNDNLKILIESYENGKLPDFRVSATILKTKERILFPLNEISIS